MELALELALELRKENKALKVSNFKSSIKYFTKQLKMGCSNAKSVQIPNESVIQNKKNESKETGDSNGLINSKNETEKDSVIKNNRIHEKSFGNFCLN